MRFGDGAWRMLPGVVPTYLARVDGVERSATELLIHVSSRPEKERWATLQGDMFTVRISTPSPDVLRVRPLSRTGPRPAGAHGRSRFPGGDPIRGCAASGASGPRRRSLVHPFRSTRSFTILRQIASPMPVPSYASRP